MYCVSCGEKIAEAASFCPFCGQAARPRTSPKAATNQRWEPAPEDTGSSYSQDSDTRAGSENSQAGGAAARRAYAEDAAREEAARPAPLAEAPRRMRDLLNYLRHELMEACRKEMAAADARKDAAKKMARAEWDSAQAQLRRKRDENQGALDDAQHHYDRLQKEIRAATEQAHGHFGSQHVALPVLNLQQQPAEAAADALDRAEGFTASTKEKLKDLLKVRRPDVGWWNISDFYVSGIVAIIIALAISIMLRPYRGGNFFPVFVLIIATVSAGMLAAIFVLRKKSVLGRLTQKYAAWAQSKQVAEYWLDRFMYQAREAHRQAVAGENLFQSNAQRQNQQALAVAEERHRQELAELRRVYAPRIKAARRMCVEFIAQTGFAAARWDDSWSGWRPASHAALAVSFGMIGTGGYDLTPVHDSQDLEFSIPALVSFTDGRCLLFEATGEAKKRAIEALQAVMLRLLATIPPGKLRFTLIDPVGLGDNVAAFMPLGDYDKDIITSKAWTEPQHIEKRLAEITEHMETVIQKFLRKKFASIEDYNKEADEVAEPYRALVVVDFPVNFNEAAARRLVSIAQNGPRCGVHTFVVMDTAKPRPHGFNVADLEHVATVISYDSGTFNWDDEQLRSYPLEIDRPPPKEVVEPVIKQVGALAKSGMRVEVPFTKLLEMAKADENYWWESDLWEGNSSEEVKVPLGPTGARKPHYLTLGAGTMIHALVIGRTGSGKSNLMHVIITGLALAYSPEEIQLYLIDFKQGVEFKSYAEKGLPHAKVIAIESEREFGMSVLQGLDEELRRRGELFRATGVEKISNYRHKTGKPLPRILLMVDEFQEFFSQDDAISRNASLVLDRLVRQGRSSGIHVMLGSQTLGGSSPLSRSTLGQMNVRIALQCSEADSRLILAEDNPAARLLSRPGEAYYNDQGGLVEGNTLFQVALFTEKDREMYLDEVNRYAANRYATPLIFEGNKPARLEDCRPLNEMLAAGEWPPRQRAVDALLGEAIAIRPPTVASFRRQSGNNLLIITRDEAEGIGLLISSLISLAAQTRPGGVEFHIVDLSTADSEWENLGAEVAGGLPHQTSVTGRRGLQEVVASLAAEVNRRVKADRVEGPEIYLIIQGLHRARDLRPEEAGASYSSRRSAEEKRPSANELFMTLLREGPDVGAHVIAWSDTLTNALRVERRLLAECSLRVGAAMSNEDSNKLLDDSAASKLDKPHRAFFADEERPGLLEKFRPYSIPGKGWLEWASARMRARAGRD
jgi:hypothetical protein